MNHETSDGTLVLPAVGASCSCEVAARQAASTYEFEGTAVHVEVLDPARADDPSCAGRAVILPALGRVECVLDQTTDFASASKHLAGYCSGGLEVWALVPLGRLGEAHMAFSPVADFVQGWWQRPDDAVSFTAPEIA